MHRTSISIKDVDFKKIKENAEKKSLELAEYIRILIRIGLKVETAAEAGSSNPKGQDSHQGNPEIPWKTLLTWELESRYLTRYIIKTGLQETAEQRKAFLKEAKEKAAIRVEDFLED